MADVIWGWKAIQAEIGRVMGYEPALRTLKRWTDPGVIDDPLPAKATRLGRVCIKVSELESWCRRVTQ